MDTSNVRTTHEIAMMATLLGQAAGEFSKRSCTDFVITASAGNKAIAAAAIKHYADHEEWGDEEASWEDYVNDVMASDQEVFFFMDWMASYLAARCQAVLEKGAGQPFLSEELLVIAEMLTAAAEQQTPDAAQRLAASGLNKVLLAAVVKHRAADDWKTQAKAILDADGEIALPAGWILDYLAAQCRNGQGG